MLTRRELLSRSLLLAGGAISGFAMGGCRPSDERQSESALVSGELLDKLDFLDEGGTLMNTALGAELDGRLFFDHSSLSMGDLVTSTDKFYIRTRASKQLGLERPWLINLSGAKGQTRLSTRELIGKGEPLGLHIMECAGNSRRGHFGLISLADWEGVPMTSLLDRIGIGGGASRVLISGFDTYSLPSLTSIPGASWIFSPDDLRKSRAFLATKMNGNLLTPDHGAPVRLVVPGWYGCCCIKWVNEIIPAKDDVSATSQMQEYSGRTFQNGTPVLARDYEPATIDAAAMPIRVEKWRVSGRILYKVIVICWGGSKSVELLKISFNGGADWRPMERVNEKPGDSWALWTHLWSPKETGTYKIRLKVDDPTVRTRRLDMGYYDREVEIAAG